MTVRQDLTAANGRISNALVTRAGALASQSFRNLGSWRDDDIDRYLKQIGPALTGVKREAAKSTIAFYKSMADLTGQDFRQPVINASDLATKTLRNGVDTSVVYRRPFVDMRTALSKGSTMTYAIEAGARRANYLASTEVQLAKRGAGLKARRENDNIVGYVRTLTGFENCGLCYVASTQRYTRGDLLPIHPGCDCGEMPIYGAQDPGQVIDEVRLDAAHENVRRRFGVYDRGARELDYRQIRITEHGEMGPMLTVRKQQFTGPEYAIGPRTELNKFYLDDGIATQYGDEALEISANLDRVARSVEPNITDSVTAAAAANNATLEGLKFRRKTKESLARKITKEAAEKTVTLQQAADDIGDAVRYTMVKDPDNYVEMAQNTIAQFEAEGYTVVKVKNYWQPNNAYKGINVNFLDPDGYKFELQFHTPQSFTVKEPSHQLYNQSRKIADGPERSALQEESRRLWDTVDVPANVDGIGTPTIQ